MNDPPVNRPVHEEENYYEGYISTSFDDTNTRSRYLVQLQGAFLVFYPETSRRQYVERINLAQDTRIGLVQGENLELKLSIGTRTWTFEVDTQEQAMLWEATILTVTQNRIPQHLNLLPGQRVMLEEILQVRQRIENDLLEIEAFPEYYFDVARDEAEKMLMESGEIGCYLLRPTSDGENICLSVKQPKSSSVQHFKIMHKGRDSWFTQSRSDVNNQKRLQDIVDTHLKKYSSEILPYTHVRYATVYGTTYENERMVPPLPPRGAM
uniref:signal-transducing adaptor protein 1-like n=1 Tax=Myxine glutinosa TaxID=7769 RepID=UPI00358E7F5B